MNRTTKQSENYINKLSRIRRYRLIRRTALFLSLTIIVAVSSINLLNRQTNVVPAPYSGVLRIGVLEGVYKYGASAGDLQDEMSDRLDRQVKINLLDNESQLLREPCDLVERDKTTVCDQDYNRTNFENVAKIIHDNKERYPLLNQIIDGAFAKNFYTSDEVFVLPCVAFLPPRILTYRKDLLNQINAQTPRTLADLFDLNTKLAQSPGTRSRFVYYCHIGQKHGYREVSVFFRTFQSRYAKNIIDKIEMRGNNIYVSDIDDNAFYALNVIAEMQRAAMFNRDCLSDNILEGFGSRENAIVADAIDNDVFEKSLGRSNPGAVLKYTDDFARVSGKQFSEINPVSRLWLVSFPKGSSMLMQALDFVEMLCSVSNQAKYYEKHIEKSMSTEKQAEVADDWSQLHFKDGGSGNTVYEYTAKDFEGRKKLLALLAAKQSTEMKFYANMLRNKKLVDALKRTETVKDKWFELIIRSKDNVEAQKLWVEYLEEWKRSGGNDIMVLLHGVASGGY